jgi:BMFP domain-containing protein YqiC
MHVTTRQLDEALTQVNNLLKELYQRVDALEARNNGRTEPKRKVASKSVEPTS